MLNSMTFRSMMIAIACTLSYSAHAVAEDLRKVDIPAGELSTALRQLADQAGVEFVYSVKDIRGIRTRGVRGEYSAEKAVTLLLEGTKLHLTVHESGALLIAPPVSPSSSSATPEAGRGKGTTSSAEERPKSFWSRLRLAQSEPPSPSQGESGGEVTTGEKRQAQSENGVELEEVLVTGSHIRGAQAAGSKVIVIDRETIDAGGYSRIQDVLATLTQGFKGVGEESIGGQVQNYNRGAEIQLRGLGPGTTLTLVNGQRQALGGRYGTVLDISSIAASAVERLEILPEGASALYGSDAIGGVINIILRKDFEGMETRARLSTAGGDANGTLVAQLWGTNWQRGHALVGYQYDERDALAAADRAYSAANNDYRRFDGSDYRELLAQYSSNPGTIMIGGQPHAIPHGQNGTNVTIAQLTRGTANYTDGVTYTDVLPEQKMHSAFLNASHEMTDRWALSLDGRYGKRDNRYELTHVPATLVVPTANAFNRIGAPVTVRYDFTRDLGPQVQSGTTETYVGTLGLTGALSTSWQMKLAGTYSQERNERFTGGYNNAAVTAALNRSDPATALNVFADGSNTNPATLAALVRRDLDRGTWTTKAANVLADGPLFNVPAGTVRLALGGDYRNEELQFFQRTLGVVAADHDVGRKVSAVFAELGVPLLAGSPAGRVDLSLAGRYEDYDEFGTTFNPKVGLGWQPLNWAKLRGTWGTSFRVPPFWQADPQFSRPVSLATSVADPRSSTNRSQVLVLAGPDPDLKEETADVWTAGIDFLPLENLTLSLTYFDINYEGKIQSAGAFTTFLTQESQFAPVIVRDPSPAQVAAICSSPDFASGDCSLPIAAILDARVLNLSKVTSRGIDVDMNYSWSTAVGRWGVGLRSTHTLDYETQLTDSAPTLDVVDTVGRPLALRLSGSLSWSWGGFSAQTIVNHAGRYQDRTLTPVRSVHAWTTVDLNLGYRTGPDSGWLDNTRLYVSALNALDEDPPFVNQAFVFGYDAANATLLGRQFSLQAVKEW